MRKVAVIGVGQTPHTSHRREDRERTEVAFAAIKAALDSANLTISDIDAIVFSTVDGFEGVNRVERTMEVFGQVFNKPVISVNTGGTAGGSAFKEAYNLVASGLFDVVLVYASSTFTPVVDAQQILNTASPPLFEKPFGIGAVHMAAFYCTKYMHEYGATEEDFAMVAAKNHRNATLNPYAHIRKGYNVDDVLASPMIAWPLRMYMICPVSGGASSLIMACEERARKLSDTPVWIKAVSGSITNTFLTGYRDYTGFDTLNILAKKVYSKAGITNPKKQIHVAEVFNPYAPFELLEYEALGFCKKGDATKLIREGVTTLNGELPVNPSGGVLCTNAGIEASLLRYIEVTLQLMGKAGKRQVKDNPEVGLAHSWGGNLCQFHTLGILSL